MQINNPNLDKVHHEAIVPAIKACGLDPKRVDKHNVGRLLNSEIAGFIGSSQILVADLTNERSNCYLEVGYAMGLGKFENLILTAREDHNVESPNHKNNGPKVHFDLSGYDILWWFPDKLDEFKSALEKKIRFRLTRLTNVVPVKTVDLDEKWFAENRNVAISGYSKKIKGNIPGYFEVRVAPSNSVLNTSQDQLIQVAEQASKTDHGWPIGRVFWGARSHAKPTKEGVFVELSPDGLPYYDYWALRRDGSFYLLRNLHEDNGMASHFIYFDSRIAEITETLLYTQRLYSTFGLPYTSEISLRITHNGLKGRTIGSSSTSRRLILGNYVSAEDEIPYQVKVSIERIQTDLIDLIEKFSKELFTVFDFFQINRKVMEDIIRDFRKQIQA